MGLATLSELVFTAARPARLVRWADGTTEGSRAGAATTRGTTAKAQTAQGIVTRGILAEQIRDQLGDAADIVAGQQRPDLASVCFDGFSIRIQALMTVASRTPGTSSPPVKWRVGCHVLEFPSCQSCVPSHQILIL